MGRIPPKTDQMGNYGGNEVVWKERKKQIGRSEPTVYFAGAHTNANPTHPPPTARHAWARSPGLSPAPDPTPAPFPTKARSSTWPPLVTPTQLSRPLASALLPPTLVSSSRVCVDDGSIARFGTASSKTNTKTFQWRRIGTDTTNPAFSMAEHRPTLSRVRGRSVSVSSQNFRHASATRAAKTTQMVALYTHFKYAAAPRRK